MKKLTKILAFTICLTGCTRNSGPNSSPDLTPAKQALPVSSNQVSGNEGGNGGDTIVEQNFGGWFLSADVDKSISACITSSPTFGVSTADAKQIFADAFATWATYSSFYGVSLVHKGKTYNFERTLDWVSCDAPHDLEVLLGVDNKRSVEDRKSFVNPIGYVWQTKHDPKGSSAGYVWLAPPSEVDEKKGFPNWNMSAADNNTVRGQAQFRQVVLHEVGHIFGCDHVPGTIMRADILKAIEDDSDGTRYAQKMTDLTSSHNLRLGQIDGESPLLSRRGCFKRADNGCVSDIVLSAFRPSKELAQALGISSVNISAQVQVSEVLSEKLEPTQLNIEFNFYPENSSDVISKELNVVVTGPAIPSNSLLQVFKMQIEDSTSSYKTGDDLFYTGIASINGTNLNVLIEHTDNKEKAINVWLLLDGARVNAN